MMGVTTFRRARRQAENSKREQEKGENSSSLSVHPEPPEEKSEPVVVAKDKKRHATNPSR